MATGWLRSIIAIGVGACAVAAAAVPAHAQSAAVQRLLDDGDEAFAGGDYARAASHYDRAIAAEPRTIEAVYYAKRADIFAFRKEFDAGLRWLAGTAEPIKPKDPLLLEKKAVLLDGAGRGDEAAALAEQLIVTNPKAFTLHLLLGNHHFDRQADGATRAVTAFDAFLTHRPVSVAGADAMIRTKIGYASLYLGTRGGSDAALHFERARRELTTALANQPSPQLATTARAGLCAAHTGLRHWKQAAAECGGLLEANPAIDPAIHYNLAVARLGLADLARARASVASYLALRPSSVRGHLLSGDVESAANELDAAGLAYRRAADLEPKNPDLALRMARRHLRHDPPELTLASEALRLAHDAYPDSIDVLVQLADTLQRRGQSRDAAALAVQGAARPGLPAATRARMLLIAGDALYDDGTDLVAALGHYQHTLATEPTNASARSGAVDTLNRIAFAALAAGDRAAARDALTRALALDDRRPISRFNLGVLMLGDGDVGGAMSHLEKAHASAPTEARTSWALAQAKLAAGEQVAALTHYRAALDDARRAGDVEVWARVGSELGGVLTWAGQADEAVTLLTQVRSDGGEVGQSPDARRHLAVAYLHRGLGRLDAGQNTTALADLDKADDKLLEGDEPQVRSFAMAVAGIRLGRVKDGRATLQALATKLGGQAVPWLNPPYDKLGVEYYLAYSYYADNSATADKTAVSMFERLARKATGELGTNARILLRSSYQRVGYQLHQAGRLKDARKMFDKARGVNVPRRTDNVLLANLAALDADGKPDAARRALEALGGNPPEALVNLGVLLDREGKPLDAYRVWKQARDQGARTPQLGGWIANLERLLGSNAGEI